MEIMHKLSALDSLKISSLVFSLSIYLSINEKNLRFISNKNKITKVYLEKMNAIEEVYFLMKLCPRMTYLKVDFINCMDVKLFVKFILMKIKNECNQYLRSLCLHSPIRDDEIVEKLQEMINSEKLLRHFTIKRIFDNIYVEWK